MILKPLEKFLIILLSMVTLIQSTGLVNGLLNHKLMENIKIQMDFEGDSDKEDEKTEIDKFIRNPEGDNLLLDQNKVDFTSHNISFYLFVFEIPIPPPELS